MKKTRILLTILILSTNIAVAQQKNDYKNPKLPTKDRVSNLISQMTLEEKIGQMDMFATWSLDAYKNSKELMRIGIGAWIIPVATAKEVNEIQKLSEKTRLKIPFLMGTDAAHGNAMSPRRTIFPTSISMAATFNPDLLHKTYKVTAQEVRSNGVHWTFAPSVDIVHDARWGRTGETYGEDPFLSSTLVREAVKAMQNYDDPQLRLAACAKHMVGGGASVGGINHANAEISERMLRSYFMPPYQAAIEEGIYTIMPGHNDVNGIPCHTNKWLLEDIVRKEYGFNGFYITDMGDLENLFTMHHTAENQKDALRQGVNAGIDMHMNSDSIGQFITPMMQLVKEGKISEETINDAVARILTVKFNLGLFENRYVDEKKQDRDYSSKDSKQLALEAARQSIILLKNSGNLLPLDKKKYKKILVTGPNTNNQALLGDWSFTQPADHVTTILQGIQDYVGTNTEVVFSYSGRLKAKKSNVVVNTTDPTTQLKNLEDGGELNDYAIQDAANKAKDCDLAIVAVGGYGNRTDWGYRTYGESADRPSIDFYGRQEELIREIAATGIPVIVVLINGNPINNTWVTKNIPTIIDIFEPGMFGGKALAEILFGDINPSGKLPVTVPQSAGQIPLYYYQTASRYKTGYGLGSSRADDKPAFAFGHGLSYTTFDYTNPRVNSTSMEKDKDVIVTVDVTNSGQKAGYETVMCFVNDEVSSVVTPIHLLKGFNKIWLEPSETKSVTITIPVKEFGLWNQDMKYVVEPGKFNLKIGSASDDIKHVIKLVF